LERVDYLTKAPRINGDDFELVVAQLWDFTHFLFLGKLAGKK
jgi:hypothetical protein